MAAVDIAAEWQRIWKLKWDDRELARARAVEHALKVDRLKRENEQKRLSKKEVLELYKVLQEKERREKIAQLLQNRPENYFLINTGERLEWLAGLLRRESLLAVDCETAPEADGGREDALDPWAGRMVGFSMSLPVAGVHVYIPFGHDSGRQLAAGAVFGALREYLESRRIVMHNAPFDIKFFLRCGVDMTQSLYFDTLIAGKVLQENDSHGLKELCKKYLGMPGDGFDELFGDMTFNRLPLEPALVYAAGDAEKTLKLYDFQLSHLDKLPRLKKLFFDVEMPVLRTMTAADYRGVLFDSVAAHRLDADLGKEQERLEALLRDQLGDCNFNSPAQLSKKLFVEMRLPDLSHGKYSTSTKYLKRLADRHPAVKTLVEYRTVAKLRQSFTQTLPKQVREGGRIHPWHNTYGAATGRFSCKNPNTQQLPNKDERSRRIRQLFKPDPRRVFIGMDYSQIELRILAHFCGDEAMLRAYREGIDIHAVTASEVFGIPLEKVLADEASGGSSERKKAKNVNFGIVYGITEIGLAYQIGCTEKTAKGYIDSYFEKFPGIKGFIDQCVDSARKKGYVESILHRKRRLHGLINSPYGYERGKAERQAANFVIQASAADLLKKAMVDLIPVLDKWGVGIVLQIHDELVFDAPADIPAAAVQEIKAVMENAVQLLVPVKVDCEIMPDSLGAGVSMEEWFKQREVA